MNLNNCYSHQLGQPFGETIRFCFSSPTASNLYFEDNFHSSALYSAGLNIPHGDVFCLTLQVAAANKKTV